ncbi:hypothetical protein DPMN_085421 [Dreissena polymorpha]|uniref:non-specific serine/threonine protein kinase n=1 Tax=Dreissena polymorpha TaxID=45954 RepID=A0A9D3YGZ3_DREPO|nr:hypothetical protein DPMN_085421 [Dreissena polymorpha]
MSDELEKIFKMYTEEKRRKEQAVNKLAEMMNRMDIRNQGNKKELMKKEKECRKLQQELQMVSGLCTEV